MGVQDRRLWPQRSLKKTFLFHPKNRFLEVDWYTALYVAGKMSFLIGGDGGGSSWNVHHVIGFCLCTRHLLMTEIVPWSKEKVVCERLWSSGKASYTKENVPVFP